MVRLLALDLGTKTGYAVFVRNKIFSGTQDFKAGRFEGGGMRYLKFNKWLEEISMLMTTGGISGKTVLYPDAIYFEEVRRHRGVDAAHAYGGFLGTLTSWCEDKKIPYLGIPVGTIKKHATGKGNANKDEMVEMARKKWPARYKDYKDMDFDDNEADACHLLDYVKREIIKGDNPRYMADLEAMKK